MMLTVSASRFGLDRYVGTRLPSAKRAGDLDALRRRTRERTAFGARFACIESTQPSPFRFDPRRLQWHEFCKLTATSIRHRHSLAPAREFMKPIHRATVALSLVSAACAAVASVATLAWRGAFPEPIPAPPFNGALAEARGWSAVTLGMRQIEHAFGVRAPRRTIAAFALASSLLLSLAWLKGIAARTAAGEFGWPQGEDHMGTSESSDSTSPSLPAHAGTKLSTPNASPTYAVAELNTLLRAITAAVMMIETAPST